MKQCTCLVIFTLLIPLRVCHRVPLDPQDFVQHFRDYFRPIESGQTALTKALLTIHLNGKTHWLDYELRTRHLTHGQWACKMNIWPDVVSAGKNYTYKSVFTGGQLYRNDQTFPARFHFMERFLLKGIHSTLNALMDMAGGTVKAFFLNPYVQFEKEFSFMSETKRLVLRRMQEQEIHRSVFDGEYYVGGEKIFKLVFMKVKEQASFNDHFFEITEDLKLDQTTADQMLSAFSFMGIADWLTLD